MQKIKNIEFLRIIGCIAIVCFHFFTSKAFNILPFYEKMHNMTNNGRMAVDLFFIIAGFFFILTFKKEVSLFDFLKKKIARLWPVMVFAIFLYWFFSLFHFIKFDFYQSIFTLFGLNGTILVLNRGTVGVFWYVSIMVIVMGFLYYALKNFNKKYVNFILAILIFFCYGGLVHFDNGNLPLAPKVFFGFFQVGTLRAIGGVGIGYFVGEWYKNNIDKIKNIRLNIYQILFITFLEISCLFFIINNLMFHQVKCKNFFIFIIVFSLAIVLMLVKKGFISRLLDNDIMPFIAKYCYSIYMVHGLTREIFIKEVLSKHQNLILNHFAICSVVYFVLAIGAGVLTYHLIERPFLELLKKKWKIG